VVLIRAVAGIVLASWLTAACGGKAAERPLETRVVRLATGSRQAASLSRALADAYRRSSETLDVRLSETPGSSSNVDAIQRGDADIGFAFADAAYLAYVGKQRASAYTRLRGIAVLEIDPIHIIVGSRSGITTPSQLRQRRVAFGPRGSGTASSAELVLSAFGIDANAVQQEFLPFGEATSRLAQGTLDAMFLAASDPADNVMVALKAGGRLIPIEGPPVERLRRDFSFLRRVAISPETYPELPASVHTIGVDNLLICRQDLDEQLVYELTRNLFDMLPALSAQQPSLRLVRMADVAATPVPLHEGAARYYRERELLR